MHVPFFRHPFAFLHCAPAIAQASKEILWNVFDFPPYFITHGPDKGKGIYDTFLRELTGELSDFKHHIEASTPNRAEAFIKRGESLCTISRTQTPERDAYSIFARHPYLYILPVRVVVIEKSKAAVTALVKDGEVSLANLLEANTVRIGMVENRRFGSPIDALMENASRKNGSPVVKWTTESLSADALKLMALGRFDATLAYPSEFSKLRDQQPNARFVSFPLAELHNLQPAKVSCANTELGRAVVGAVDRLPLNRRSVSRLQSAYEELLPLEDREAYRQLVSSERSKAK